LVEIFLWLLTSAQWVIRAGSRGSRSNAIRNHTRATTSFRTVPVVIGSSLHSCVISLHVIVWAIAQAQGSDNLDHERDITLAIHAAIPDLVGETNRHVIQACSCYLTALARQFKWNSREAGLSGKDTNPITAARRRYKSKGPFDDR
jgi:hypothetical protein